MSKTVMISSDRFDTPRSLAVDAFMTGGYRKMLLRMLEGSVVDLMGSDEVNQEAAKNWFDPVMGRDAGITFEDCVVALGVASMIEEIRQMALQEPAKLLERLQDFHGGVARFGRSHKALKSADEAGMDVPGVGSGPRVDSSSAEAIHRAIFAGA